MDPLVLYPLALLLLIYRVGCAKQREIPFLALFLAAGAALALYEHADMLLMLTGILVFNGMVSTYHSKENYAFLILAVFLIIPISYFTAFVSQMMLLGFLSGAYFFMGQANRAGADVERRRDVVQIILGLAFIAAFAFEPALYVRLILISAILVASLIGNFSVRNRKSTISRTLHSFERSGANLGQGAMWLAAGALVAMSFLNNTGLVAALVALFVGDASATLVGTTYRKPLPYNSKKSIAGTFAYFLTTAIVSFPFVGYLGLLTGAVAALVESSPVHIDDNFDTVVVLTAEDQLMF